MHRRTRIARTTGPRALQRARATSETGRPSLAAQRNQRDTENETPTGATAAGRRLLAGALADAVRHEQTGARSTARLTALAYGAAEQLDLHGTTEADFDNGRFHVDNLVTEQGQDCPSCGRRTCVHATGQLVATYHVDTRVTLPRIPRRPRLTDCQREAVQQFIDTVLGPHEEEHVAAFKQYNGTTRTAFDLMLCRPQLRPTLQQMVRDEEQQRRTDAKAASRALDPFVRQIDGLDCSDDE